VRRLFSQTKELEKNYFNKTGIFPANHAIVFREPAVKAHPDLPRKLYAFWDEARKLSLEDDEDPTFSNFVWIRDLWEEEQALFGGDPWRYGMTANRKIIETLIRYGVEQGITKAGLEPGTLFLPIE
ncbi:MAG: hypothetical protein ACREH5_00505, partial [Candidatus Omnitrophota bacterium]